MRVYKCADENSSLVVHSYEALGPRQMSNVRRNDDLTRVSKHDSIMIFETTIDSPYKTIKIIYLKVKNVKSNSLKKIYKFFIYIK